MNEARKMDEKERRIWQGRLMFALVSARSRVCPDKKCGRRGHCLARFGQKGSNFHTKIGACRNMSEAEWKIVGLGMFTNYIDRVRPHLCQRSDARAAQEPELSREEAERRWWSPEEVAKRAEMDRIREAWRGEPFWHWLWFTVEGDELRYPSGPARVNEAVVREMAARGCRCAQDGALVCLRERWGRIMPADCCEGGMADAKGVFPQSWGGAASV